MDLWRGGPVRRVGLVCRVVEHCLQGLFVTGQYPRVTRAAARAGSLGTAMSLGSSTPAKWWGLMCVLSGASGATTNWCG